MKKVVLNNDLGGYKYTLYVFTKDEYIHILEQFNNIETEVIYKEGYIIKKSTIIAKGTIPDKYPFRNKSIIPTEKFRAIGTPLKANLFTTGYYCYPLSRFGSPTLIIHEDINSSWKCLLGMFNSNYKKLMLIKEKVDDKTNVSS